MEAGHVATWNKGGKAVASNSQMLGTTHNRAKGYR